MNPKVFMIFGFFIIWAFGFDTVGRRLDLQLDGIVVSSRDIPPTRGPRYVTEYALRGPDHVDRVYVAGPTDASLPRSMPAGIYLKKRRGHLYYEQNGQRVDDFPVLFYVLTVGMGCSLVIWSLVVLRRKRPTEWPSKA
jgi:hypothetical protein